MSPRSLLAGACAVLSLALLAAPAAPAMTVQPDVLDDCGNDPTVQPFLPWLDPMNYVFVRNGGAEATSPAWGLQGGATVVSGNESFYVHSADDRHSVALPAGASATTPLTCMGLDRPTLRFFLKRTSTSLLSSAAALKVDVLFEDLLGNQESLAVALLPATTDWQPSLPLFIGADKLPDLVDRPVVQFRFTAVGGDFRIDDVYVDPYGKY